MSFVQTLRAATAADHQMVDDRFGGFSLDVPADYRRFLTAHARALPAVEMALAGAGAGAGADGLPEWRGRTDLLAADLAAMQVAMPAMLPFAPDGNAALWGALYVIEGSRLGGQLLAQSVRAGMPVAYLSARHRSGEWRDLLTALEQRATQEGPAWQDGALAGARATFALYDRAAGDRVADGPA